MANQIKSAPKLRMYAAIRVYTFEFCEHREEERAKHMEIKPIKLNITLSAFVVAVLLLRVRESSQHSICQKTLTQEKIIIFLKTQYKRCPLWCGSRDISPLF
jgi:hypothetical protein